MSKNNDATNNVTELAVNELLSPLDELKKEIQAKMPNYKVEGQISTGKITVFLAIGGNMKPDTIAVAKDLGLPVSSDGKAIYLKQKGKDIKKIFNGLHEQWELFYNSVAARNKSNKRIAPVRI